MVDNLTTALQAPSVIARNNGLSTFLSATVPCLDFIKRHPIVNHFNLFITSPRSMPVYRKVNIVVIWLSVKFRFKARRKAKKKRFN